MYFVHKETYIVGQSLFYLSKEIKMLVYIQLVTGNHNRTLSTELHIAFHFYVMCVCFMF